jgi:uncharacterized protein (DUF433 family)
MSPQIIQIDPEILNGLPCFAGTRVPVKALFDYLEHGQALADFFDDFPSVRPEQAVALLEEARALVVEHANTA